MFLQGKLCASSHTGRRGEMRVAEGSRAGCASVSSVFGHVHLHANERKIISSREALYQLLLRKKTPTQTVSASLQVCPRCFTQRTEKGDVWTQCPALCTVLRAKTPFPCQSVPFLLPRAGVLIMCRISGKFITHKVLVGL